MSVVYVPVLWNSQKKRYDLFLWGFNIIFLTAYFILNKILFPQLITATLIIRGFGLLSIVLLHIILSIGPLTRINSRFLPLLYNRRHLGVSLFIIASVHAIQSFLWFHGGGNVHPLVSLFTSNTHYVSFLFFPFQTLGFAAYSIIMIMAFTSHDFWLAALTPRVWKAMHMLIYFAYFLVILHVALGIIQLENNLYFFLFLLAGMVWLIVIHLISGWKEWKFDKHKSKTDEAGWIHAGNIDGIPENRARIIVAGGERVAVFKYDGKISAVHNVCKHQLGPLGEGKIVDGCITCPWHGYQYFPHNGCSPPPFTEKITTYQTRLSGKEIFVNPRALPEGTETAPVIISENSIEDKNVDEFYIGWQTSITKNFRHALPKFIFPAILSGFLFMIIFSFTQKHIASSSFDYDHPVSFSGTLSTNPFPHIRTISGRDAYGNPAYHIYPLVNAYKFGAAEIINRWCGEHKAENCYADITGSLIQRNGTSAIELTEGIGSLKETGGITAQPAFAQLLGDTILSGEIVDPKCYLGAMNPGEGKPHRSCAIRCISGGIIPVLTWKDVSGRQYYAALSGDKGKPINHEILFAVAEPVMVKGKLYKIDNWYWMEINISGIKRLAVNN